MLTLRNLLHLTPDDRHPRIIARERRLIAGLLIAWGISYAWAVFCLTH